MTSFVTGFLAELVREFDAWLDRILPARRIRRSIRTWRRSRPFWAAVWTMTAGVLMVAAPLAPLPLMLRIGTGAMSALGISLVLIAGGVFFLTKPDQRAFVSICTAIASLVALATTNLGGFGIGTALGILGSSMAFGWTPDQPDTEPRADRDERDHDGGDGDEEGLDAAGDRDEGTEPAGTGESREHSGPDEDSPPARSVRGGAHRSHRKGGGTGPTTALVVLVTPAALLLSPLQGEARADTEWPDFLPDLPSIPDAPAPSESPPFGSPSPSPSGSPSPEVPSPSGSPSATPSPTPEAEEGGEDDEEDEDDEGDEDAPQVTLPCLTGVDTGGLPNPETTGDGDPPEGGGGDTSPDTVEDLEKAEPGELPEDPEELSARRPPIVIGDQPGRPRATYPVGPDYPEVGADSLTAHGAIIHGATYLDTVREDQLKVLWVHADQLVAENYTFSLTVDDQVHTIDVDLDISDVDIYVTELTGSITIPFVDVGTPRVCVGADIVPANLPIAVNLPKLSVTEAEAGQVLIDAESVGTSDLSIDTLLG
ncbi:DUF6114 domain-containing protein [Halostreptopolyspora alba]|uniref:Uncharacterized protein n=1 Tax=Halostreptopolyspora alba TaxID=2487137 RepID=A0A3N0E2X4_9ACTN|nr:hypothetical protein EFW17_20015 [Nocardiopsaceae bacterium YIM 96095]